MATEKRQFTLRLPDHIFEAIKLVAKKEKRSIAVMIEVILEQALFEYEGFEPNSDERKEFFLTLNQINKDPQ